METIGWMNYHLQVSVGVSRWVLLMVFVGDSCLVHQDCLCLARLLRQEPWHAQPHRGLLRWVGGVRRDLWDRAMEGVRWMLERVQEEAFVEVDGVVGVVVDVVGGVVAVGSVVPFCIEKIEMGNDKYGQWICSFKVLLDEGEKGMMGKGDEEFSNLLL